MALFSSIVFTSSSLDENRLFAAQDIFSESHTVKAAFFTSLEISY